MDSSIHGPLFTQPTAAGRLLNRWSEMKLIIWSSGAPQPPPVLTSNGSELMTGGLQETGSKPHSLTLLSFLNRPVPQQTRLSSLQNNIRPAFQTPVCSCSTIISFSDVTVPVSLGMITDSTKSFIHYCFKYIYKKIYF